MRESKGPGAPSVAEYSCTSGESNLRDRVLGEGGKNSFIALPGKGGHRGLMTLKNCVPTQEDLVRSFIALVQGLSC